MKTLVLNLTAAIVVVAAVGILPRGASREGDVDLFFFIGALAIATFVAAWSSTPRARHRRVRS